MLRIKLTLTVNGRRRKARTLNVDRQIDCEIKSTVGEDDSNPKIGPECCAPSGKNVRDHMSQTFVGDTQKFTTGFVKTTIRCNSISREIGKHQLRHVRPKSLG